MPLRQPTRPSAAARKPSGIEPGVAHEHARGREVEDEKSRRGRRNAGRERGEDQVAGDPSAERVGREAEQRHAAGETVRTVHEVVEVGDPYDGERCGDCHAGCDPRQCDEHERAGRSRVRGEAHRDRQVSPVVEKDDDGQRSHKRREHGSARSSADASSTPATMPRPPMRGTGVACSDRSFGRSSGSSAGRAAG